MIKVREIVTKARISMNDSGFIAIWGHYYAEGGTRNEALNNLVDEINAEKGFRNLIARKRMKTFWHKIGMN